MPAEYYINLTDTAGALVATVTGGMGGDGGESSTGFTSLAYRNEVNAAGYAQITFAGNHPARSLLPTNGQVEVYRRNTDLSVSWYRDFVGIFRGQTHTTRETGNWTIDCPGIMSVLGWRNVAWYAGTANRSTFTSAASETIMKTLVSYNAGSNATAANGRVRDGITSGKLSNIWTISNQADGAAGNSKSWSCAWDNLLGTLQALAKAGAGGDFDLIKTAATTFEFRWYTGQRGTNRTASVIFSLDRGNMANPQYTYSRQSEATVAIVAGQGDGSSRVVVTRNGADQSSSNDIEAFVDGRSYSTTAALQAIGDKAMFDRRARASLNYEVLQVPNAYYGKDYFVGDLVTARYLGSSFTQKVNAVNVAFDQSGNERITVEMATNG
jgi:hypothetical protein